ncbi:hypothetical protein IFM89_014956 [Coptis chinensis]|uniref:RRM domain-containing protein n=1 Tax=Coptis chinensis TaxID=261450 RepID=A0A835LM92_9MAGN|nr:hypothetical protein IFM89_014956 [Coptis chinensis]
MANPLDMPLDDIIKSDKGRGRGGTRQGQGQRRGRGRGGVSNFRSAGPKGNLRTFSRNKTVPWQRGLLEDSLIAAGYSGTETGAKLYVSNLHSGVTNEDIKELFSLIGELKRYTVHYDRNGRSSGSAEVIFTRRADALAAMKRYNNVQLDGKPMNIEIIGTSVATPVSARVNVVGGANGRGMRTVFMPPGSGRARTSAPVNRGSRAMLSKKRVVKCSAYDCLTEVIPLESGGMRGGFQRGRGRGRGRGGFRGHRGHGKKEPIEKSADELNKELDNYHAEAMNIS